MFRPRVIILQSLPYTIHGAKTGQSRSHSSAAPYVRPLYRILVRACQRLRPTTNDDILLQPLLDVHQYGNAMTVKNIVKASRDNILKTVSMATSTDEWFQRLLADFEHRDDTIRDEESYRSIWTDYSTLIEALRFAFREIDEENATTAKALAIQAFQYLSEQEGMQQTTSSYDTLRIRVTATSKCIGRSMDSKMRFAYRIRIENRTTDKTVQLLGRTWHIQDTTEEGEDLGPPVLVNAPQTGAVGHLPVLHPGEAFQYISGSELGTLTGYMKGSLHCAWVPDDTPCAIVGQHVSAFESPDRFEAIVLPFALVGDKAIPPRG